MSNIVDDLDATTDYTGYITRTFLQLDGRGQSALSQFAASLLREQRAEAAAASGVKDRTWTGTCPEWCEHASDDRHQWELDSASRQARIVELRVRRDEPDFIHEDPDEDYSVEHTLTFGTGEGWRVALSAWHDYGRTEPDDAKADVYVEDDAIVDEQHVGAMAEALLALAQALPEARAGRVA